ncbi:MAG: hypothetical protein OXI52_06580 [Caldilineaceae bacterium]|nr:hypothetical protein [Caldilineaceae bacterium]
MSSSRDDDVYGGNYPKARRLAFARSSGRCQFCGLREAEEGHHWAFHNYPSENDVQGHDLTALCKTCHELATTMRDWMARKGADIDFLRREIEQCTNFTEKREAISYWFYPEAEDEGYRYDFEEPEPLDRFHFINQQLDSIEEPEFVTAEPQVPVTKLHTPVRGKDSPLTFFLWIFLGPTLLITVIYLLHALGN